MMKPGWAPPTPAVQEPSVVPAGSCVESSPKYQTLPWLSCAYQSSVSSISTPSSSPWSRTSTVLTPSILGVLCVTVTTSSAAVFCSVPRYVKRVPGTSGQYGLSIVVDDLLKLCASNAGHVGAGLD